MFEIAMAIGIACNLNIKVVVAAPIDQQVKQIDELIFSCDWKTAAALCDTVLSINSNNYLVLSQFALRKGIIAFESGDIDKSREILHHFRNLENKPFNQGNEILYLYYYLKGRHEAFDLKFERAVQSLNKALTFLENKNAGDFYAFSIYKDLGQVYAELKKFSEARLYYEKAEKWLKMFSKNDNFYQISLDALKGSSYYYENKINLAANFFDQCHKKLMQLGMPKHPALTDAYFQIINYGILNNNIHDMDIFLYLLSDILFKYYFTNDYHYVVLDYYRGQYYSIIYDYEKAITYFQRVNDNAPMHQYFNVYRFLSTQWLAYIARIRKEWQKAIELNAKAIELSEQAGHSACYNYKETGLIYDMLNNPEKATAYYKQAYSCAKSNPKFENRFVISQTYLELGKLYLKRNDINNAIFYLNEAIIENRKIHDVFSKQLIYTNLGRCLIKLKKYKAALDTLQSALIFSTNGFKDKSIYANPDLSNINAYETINNVLNLKAYCLYYYYHDITHNPRDLECSALTYQLSAKLLEKKLASINNELSELEYVEKCKITFNNVVELSNDVFKITRNPLFALQSFTYAEKSKMLVLLLNQHKMNAKQYAGIPDSLINIEKSIRNEISKISYMLNQHEEKGFSPEKTTSTENTQLADLYTQYDALQKTFEEKYPAYFNLKYNFEIAPVNEIQQFLKPDQVILEYAITNKELYTFALSREKLYIYVQSIDSGFHNAIHHVRNYLSHNPLIHQNKSLNKNYADDAFYLYKILIYPFSSIISGKSLIIIPDEDLNLIPFEVLLTKPVKKNEYNNFQKLAYLIKSYPVSYAYSATLLKSSLQSKKAVRRNRIAAFFPDYSAYKQEASAEEINRYNDLMPLEATQDEIDFFRKFRRAKIFSDNQSDETSFKKHAGKFGIIHISGHTIIDEDNSQFSCLLFTRQNTTEDGILYSYEIYNNKLNAQMLVLSGCNTGFGKMRKGEGLISLGRSFFYAGVRSLIITQWPVADKSSAMLTSNLYSLLFRGEPKDRALQKAKLRFLEQADPLLCHPYFWSGYILMGDTEKIKCNNIKSAVYLSSFLLVVGIIFFSLLRKRKVIKGA
jgi:CHAT domain-containing protein/tetratricopeptide (TPR) repeat protein